MFRDDFSDEPYEPDEDEIQELNELMRQEDINNIKRKYGKFPKNRILTNFYTESHFAGWLRTHGIQW